MRVRRAIWYLCASLNFLAWTAFAQIDGNRGGAVSRERLFERYTLQSAKEENLAFVRDPIHGRRQVIRLTLSDSDPKVAGGLRTEIVPLREYVRDGTRWYAMSVLLPRDWVPHPYPTVLAQIHTSQKTAVLSPPLSFVAEGDELKLELRSSTKPVEGPRPLTKTMADSRSVQLGPILTGSWQCFVVRANWSWTEGRGDLDVWLNRKLVHSAHNAPNAYDTWLGNYPKVGLYAPGGMGVERREIHVDYVWVGGGDTSFDEIYRRTPCAE